MRFVVGNKVETAKFAQTSRRRKENLQFGIFSKLFDVFCEPRG